jgi:hypothetical protein
MGRTGNTPFRFDSTYVGGEVTRPLSKSLTGHANLGWVRSNADGQSSTTWNLAIESALKENLDVGIESYGDDRSRPWVGVGVRYAVSSRVTLGTSYAMQSNTLQQRLLTAGLTVAF